MYRLPSAIDVDTVRGIASLPLRQGFVGRRLVWYVVTESSDRADAARRGVTWAPRLAALAGTPAVQRARGVGEHIIFDSGVDFTPVRRITPGSTTGFPPAVAEPGSVGEPFYSPFVQLDDGTIINAPIIADEQAAIDRVERLDVAGGLARIRLSRGYVDDQTIWYITTDASDPMVAAMESGTLAPALRESPGEGRSDSTSARTGILAVINGETGTDNPERQGLQSALLDGLAPLNVLELRPATSGVGTAYTPAWDLHLVRWSDAVVAANQRQKLFSWHQAQALVANGSLLVEGAAGASPQPPALRAARVVINCPVIAVYARRRS